MATPAKKKSTPTYLDIDSDATSYKPLFGFAGRIGGLLKSPTVKANPELVGSLDDFLGAVYALILAKQHRFTDRPDRSIGSEPIADLAAEIAKGQVRTNGKWIAGFYFNNAIFRAAAVQHRILKIIVGEDKPVWKLQKAAKVTFPQWTSDKLNLVHDQVNELKHEPRGVHDARTVTYPDAIAAVGELLALIEAWTAANAPSTTKP